MSAALMRHVRAHPRMGEAGIRSELSSRYQNPAFPPRIKKKESEFLGAIVGIKFISQQWALAPMRGPAITGSEDMARGLPAQPCWAGPGLFKRRSRRSVSSDASNGSPTHALHIVGNRPKSKGNTGRLGGQPQLPH